MTNREFNSATQLTDERALGAVVVRSEECVIQHEEEVVTAVVCVPHDLALHVDDHAVFIRSPRVRMGEHSAAKSVAMPRY